MNNTNNNLPESVNPGEALRSLSVPDYEALPWGDVGIDPEVAVEYRSDIEKEFGTYRLKPSSGGESELIDDGVACELHAPRQTKVRTTKKPLHHIRGTFPHLTEHRRISVGRVFNFLLSLPCLPEASSEMRLDVDVNGGDDINELFKELFGSNDDECITRCANELAPIIKRFIIVSKKRKEMLREGVQIS